MGGLLRYSFGCITIVVMIMIRPVIRQWRILKGRAGSDPLWATD